MESWNMSFVLFYYIYPHLYEYIRIEQEIWKRKRKDMETVVYTLIRKNRDYKINGA